METGYGGGGPDPIHTSTSATAAPLEPSKNKRPLLATLQLRWGNNSEGEMCQFLAYADTDNKIGAYPEGNVPELKGETEDGVLMYDTRCEGGLIIGLRGAN